jgi:ribosome-binding factor A
LALSPPAGAGLPLPALSFISRSRFSAVRLRAPRPRARKDFTRMKRHRNGGAGRSRPRASTRRTDADPATDPAAFDDAMTHGGDDFFRQSANRKADQKARQLCRQVYRTLSVALPGCGDDVLQDLTVVAVDPAPDAGHLLVTVSLGSASGGGGGDDRGGRDSNDLAGDGVPAPGWDVLARLAGAAGRLRAEVARDIVRKRAPELSFRVVPRQSFAPHGEVTP